MNNLLNQSTSSLAMFLEQILPSISKRWWENTVLNKLTSLQKNRVEQKKIIAISSLDLAALLRILDQNWYQISAKLNLTSEDRHFVKEMQTVRNRWAHSSSEVLPLDDIYRDLDTLQRFMVIIQARADLIEKISHRKSSLLEKKAEQIRQEKDKIRAIEIKNSIPKAWAMLVSETNPILINLINDSLEKICGYKADVQQIENFLKNYTNFTSTITQNITEEKPTLKSRRIITSSKQIPSVVEQTTKSQNQPIKRTQRKQNPKIFPPDGTFCRFTYKGNSYMGEIKNNKIKVQEYERSFASFSAASLKITETSRNGWRDWELRTPGSSLWVLADTWRKKQPVLHARSSDRKDWV